MHLRMEFDSGVGPTCIKIFTGIVCPKEQKRNYEQRQSWAMSEQICAWCKQQTRIFQVRNCGGHCMMVGENEWF